MQTPITIDLNADLGEGAGDEQGSVEARLLPLISSANIACGFHAGGPTQIVDAVARAAALGVAIGAHPSYPDRAGFGRRFLDASPDEVFTDVLYQIGAVAAFCRAENVHLRHVKPHGALYNHAARDHDTARAIVRAVKAFDPALAVFAPPGSALYAAAASAGLKAVAELFADRAIHADGSLVSRRLPGSVLDDADLVAHRAVRMVLEHKAVAIDGSEVTVRGDTICLHGDAPGAAARAAAVRAALLAAGIAIASPPTGART